MKLEYLQYLLEVSRCGSITQAADNLFITQPALSNAIKTMESELGYSLLKRSQKGVIPTAKGLEIIRDAETICQLTEKWKQEEHTNDVMHGDIVFAAIPAFNKAFFVKLLVALKEQYPEVKLILHETERKSLYNYINNNATNIGCDMYLDYVSSEEREYNKTAYHVEELVKDYFVALVSSRNKLAEKDSITKRDVQDLLYVTYTDQSDTIYTLFCDAYGIKGNFFIDSSSVISEMIAEDIGFAIAPKLAAQNEPLVKSGAIQMKELEDVFLPLTYYCIYPKGDVLSEKERGFIAFLHEYFCKLDESLDEVKKA